MTETAVNNLLVAMANTYAKQYRDLSWQGSFNDYLAVLKEYPEVTRDAFSRLHDMVISWGVEKQRVGKSEVPVFRFFDDPLANGDDAVFGIKRDLAELVRKFEAAKNRYGVEQRVLLLHGPVGSAKSTIVRLLKHGLEHYSRTDPGRLYSFQWKSDVYYGSSDIAARLNQGEHFPCPMHEEPLKLIPEEVREEFLSSLGLAGRVRVNGDLCPACRSVFRRLLEKYQGDFVKLITDNIKVYRLLLSEDDRVGIGTFQPKDEKNQDSTELTGDIDYRAAMLVGNDADPRAFRFNGELQVANRGMVEFIEVLKLDVAFLYDLLGASQEHKIKPKKFPQTDIDLVIIGHTNEPEYSKLTKNEFMEALRDRTVKIDIHYVTKMSDEVKIHQKRFSSSKVGGKHIAPFTLEMAAMWAVLTRLEDPEQPDLTLVQKLKLYDGKTLPGFTPENVEELRIKTRREGMDGISPRYVQDKISAALVNHADSECLNPFMVLTELEAGLVGHSLINNEERRIHYKELIAVVKAEFTELLKSVVQKAIASDKDAMDRLAANYLDNIKAYTQREKVKNKFTGENEAPDERLMRSLEEKIDIPDNRKDDFRRELMNHIGAQALNGQRFDYRKNDRLLKAIELKLFEDQKDTIKLSSLVAQTMDDVTRAKVEVVKDRMVREHGCCETCAKDYLQYVASIFARGDTKKK